MLPSGLAARSGRPARGRLRRVLRPARPVCRVRADRRRRRGEPPGDGGAPPRLPGPRRGARAPARVCPRTGRL